LRIPYQIPRGRDRRLGIPVFATVARSGEGLEELARHRVYLPYSGELSRRRQARLAERVRATVERRLEAAGAWVRASRLADPLPSPEASEVSRAARA
jgi:LAO/AO transport system kinase